MLRSSAVIEALFLIIIVAALVFGSTHSCADVSAVATGFSYHNKRQYNFNENNSGVGVRFNQEGYDIQLGQYKNSYYRQSSYVLIDSYADNGYIKLGTFAALLTGYEKEYKRFTPALGLMLRYNVARTDATVRYIPSDGIKNSSVISIEAAYTF